MGDDTVINPVPLYRHIGDRHFINAIFTLTSRAQSVHVCPLPGRGTGATSRVGARVNWLAIDFSMYFLHGGTGTTLSHPYLLHLVYDRWPRDVAPLMDEIFDATYRITNTALTYTNPNNDHRFNIVQSWAGIIPRDKNPVWRFGTADLFGYSSSFVVGSSAPNDLATCDTGAFYLVCDQRGEEPSDYSQKSITLRMWFES